MVSIYFIFSFHEYHQNLPNTSGFNFLIFRVSWISSKVREYHLRQEPNTWGFNFLIFVSHEYHPRFSSFSCQNIGECHKKFPKNSMKSGSQNKKNMRGFYWNHALVIFWQKYSSTFLLNIACIAFPSSYLTIHYISVYQIFKLWELRDLFLFAC